MENVYIERIMEKICLNNVAVVLSFCIKRERNMILRIIAGRHRKSNRMISDKREMMYEYIDDTTPIFKQYVADQPEFRPLFKLAYLKRDDAAKVLVWAYADWAASLKRNVVAIE